MVPRSLGLDRSARHDAGCDDRQVGINKSSFREQRNTRLGFRSRCVLRSLTEAHSKRSLNRAQVDPFQDSMTYIAGSWPAKTKQRIGTAPPIQVNPDWK